MQFSGAQSAAEGLTSVISRSAVSQTRPVVRERCDLRPLLGVRWLCVIRNRASDLAGECAVSGREGLR
jgi:hypothetical protein